MASKIGIYNRLASPCLLRQAWNSPPPPAGIDNGGAGITSTSQSRITIFDVPNDFSCNKRIISGTAVEIKLSSVLSVHVISRLPRGGLHTLAVSAS